MKRKKPLSKQKKELEVSKLAAQAAVAKAEGNAEAALAIATAEARAIKLKSVEIARMLGFSIKETKTDDAVEYDIDFSGKSFEEISVISDYLKYIEYLESWNGELPTTLVTDGSAQIILPAAK